MYACQITGMPARKEPALDGRVKRACFNQTATATGQSDHGTILDHRGGFVRGEKLNLRHLAFS